MPRLVLYSRAGCHLCEEMLAGLQSLQAELGFTLATVDIDASPVLASRYGTRVPVLVQDGEEVCHYFLDSGALRQRLGGA